MFIEMLRKVQRSLIKRFLPKVRLIHFDNYFRFQKATRNSVLEPTATETFRQYIKALEALSLTADEQDRVLFAVSAIAAKGVLASEEEAQISEIFGPIHNAFNLDHADFRQSLQERSIFSQRAVFDILKFIRSKNALPN